MERQAFLDAVKARGGASIITHDDPDGILAAAIAVRALESTGIDDVSITFESPSAVQRGASRFLDPRSDSFVGKFIILLDLPHHGCAHAWIDHHEHPALDDSSVPAFMLHDTSRSAAALTDEFFRKRLGFEGPLCDRELLAFVNARDIGKEPARAKKEHELFSMAIHEDRKDYKFFFDLIDDLVDNEGTGWMLSNPAILTKSKRQKKRLAKGRLALDALVVASTLDEFIHAIDTESDKVGDDPTKRRVFLLEDAGGKGAGFLLFDFSDIDGPRRERELGISIPYYTISPALRARNLDYGFLLVLRGDETTGELRCTLSVNQAKPDVALNHDVSVFARSRGGGGHGFVAGFRIAPAAFLDAIKDVANVFLGQ